MSPILIIGFSVLKHPIPIPVLAVFGFVFVVIGLMLFILSPHIHNAYHHQAPCVCLSHTMQTFLLVPGSTVVVVMFAGVWVWIVID